MIYAIGDLHLGSQVEKPMSVFGYNWDRHPENIRESWLEKVNDDDAVLIPGDISWGMTLKEAYTDLLWIDQLPGKKIMIKGNHDFWWKSINRMNGISETMFFIQNNYFAYEDMAICGTRGWNCPGSQDYSPQDQKIYQREAHRLQLSLETARRAGCEQIIGMIHFPPANEKKESSLFTQIFEHYQVKQVVYGHIHGKDSFLSGSLGNINGVTYQLVSCDYLDFKLIELKQTT